MCENDKMCDEKCYEPMCEDEIMCEPEPMCEDEIMCESEPKCEPEPICELECMCERNCNNKDLVKLNAEGVLNNYHQN